MPKFAFLMVCTAVVVISLMLQPVVIAGQTAADIEAKIDKVFAKWTFSTPGCAVGVSVNGKAVINKAYGMADLEHDVRNTADTIFEAGSVSKQFTAAAVLLLARDGKFSLDDPVRKYIPELPDYGTPITIRHMLNHTSGLRDWGSVAGITGWPRTTRVHTHAHVLDIVSRQKWLNFPPGTRYSYSNTGYNLSAILVARVSGMSFAEFTKKRIFDPIGMSRTSWRDDHTRIVKDRAIAYSEERDGFHTDMPFEKVHGNGGLLTTTGDLLKWNQNFVSPEVGDAAFVQLQETPGKFNDGREHGYAFGLMVGSYKGLRQVEHSGSTAGYRAHLVRYPDQNISVGVLCNVSSGNATNAARQVADLFLAPYVKDGSPATSNYTLTPAEIEAAAGLYKDRLTGEPMNITADKGTLRVRNTPLMAISATNFVTGGGQTWEITRGTARVTDQFGTIDQYDKVAAAKPAAAQLRAYLGTYVSEDAEAVWTLALDGQSLVAKRRPDTAIYLTPVYADAFSGPGGVGTIVFRRDSNGRVTEFSIIQDRVWDMRFKRQ